MLRETLISVMAAFTMSSMAVAAPAASLSSPFPPGFLTRAAAPRPVYEDIPIESNASVRKWLNFFSHEDRGRFERFMIRGGRYRILVQQILEENDVPAEMFYLGMIESGYASRARSGARAVGIWQFMPATARQYGLRVNKEIDERLDVMRSTRAAARYLRTLKNEFGSWYMAMAAYNCGEGRIRRAVRRHRTNDYWTLARRRALPAETSDYVPKFQAAMKIASNPSAYGFGRVTHYEFPEVRLVKVRAQLDIDEIARRHRVSSADLRALNPNLLRERTPRIASGYGIWMPKL